MQSNFSTYITSQNPEEKWINSKLKPKGPRPRDHARRPEVSDKEGLFWTLNNTKLLHWIPRINEKDLFTLNERQQNEENHYNFKFLEKMFFNTYNQPDAKTSNAMSPNK